MARNEEKQYCRLNRVLLQQEKEELEKKNPKRPRLDTLVSVNEIKQWIPSIKRDLEFSLAQSQVPCYSESKIVDFQSDIQRLEREFKAFVRKIKQLEPEVSGIPWTNRPYKSQNEEKYNNTSTAISTEDEAFVPIRTPVLDGVLPTTQHKKVPEVNLANAELLDKPLAFCAQKSDENPIEEKAERNINIVKYKNADTTTGHGELINSCQLQSNGDLCANIYASLNGKQKSILGLDYSSSDSDS